MLEWEKLTNEGYCSCGEIPDIKLISDLGDGATRIERYCNRCIEQVYERIQKGEPVGSVEEIASYYNCEKGDIPKSVLT